MTLNILELIWMSLIPVTAMAMKNNNPIILCLNLTLLTLLVGLSGGSLVNSWVMYSIILIFLGGMMIVFIYVSSLASEEKLMGTQLKFLKKYFTLILGVGLLWGLSLNMKLPKYYVFHLYSSSPTTLMFLMVFLLLTLFLIVKLTESFKGALMNTL